MMKWLSDYLEIPIPISNVFGKNEILHCIGEIEDKSFKKLNSRWRTKKLSRKTRNGSRKLPTQGLGIHLECPPL